MAAIPHPFWLMQAGSGTAGVAPLLGSDAFAVAGLLMVLGLLGVWGWVRRRRKRRRRRSGGHRAGGAGSGGVVLIPEVQPGRSPSPPGPPGRILGVDSHAEATRRPRWVVYVAGVLLVAVLVLIALFVTPVMMAGPDSGAPAGVARVSVAPSEGGAAGSPGSLEAEEAEAEEEGARLVVVDGESGRRLVRWAGDGQTGRAGRPLRRALAVVVRDSSDRPVPGVEVRFEVAGSGGRVEPSTTETSDLGLATTAWWLGSRPDSLRVVAFVPAAPDLRVTFTASLEGGVNGAPYASPSPGPGADQPGEEGDRRASAPAPARRRPPAAELRPRSLLTAGGVHTCRLRSDGVACWGADTRGAASGSGGGDEREIRLLSAGVFHTCGLTDAGTIRCWPARREGAAPAAAPEREIPLPGSEVPVDVVAGTEHSCALAASGAVYCWGANTHGQLGDGTRQDASEPVRVQGLPVVVQIGTGWLHTCALTEQGQAYCWGANASGQLGGEPGEDRSRPARVPHRGTFVALAAGSAHTCALTEAGAAWCWGSNGYGQLGDGGTGSAQGPRKAEADVVFRSLTAGGVHSCGLDARGGAWCWGRNTFGQLGVGTRDDASVPMQVHGGLRFETLQAGGAHTCGETRDGDVWCWGNNAQGQVGDGSREDRAVPVRVMQP